MRNSAARATASTFAKTVTAICKRRNARRSVPQNRPAEIGLPKPKRYPMTRYQAASYLGITPDAFDYRRKKLELEPCETYEGKQGIGFLLDMNTIIAVYQYSRENDQDD
jgi:hypothetical protein